MDPFTPMSSLLSEKDTSRAVVDTSVERVTGLDFTQTKDFLAVEEPLEIQLAHGPADARAVKSISVTMRTPGHDFELAAGFLMTEGVVRDVNDIDGIVYAVENTAPLPGETQGRSSALPYQPRKNIVRVELAPDVKVSLANLERNFVHDIELRHLWKSVAACSANSLPGENRKPHSRSMCSFSTRCPHAYAKHKASSIALGAFMELGCSTPGVNSSAYERMWAVIMPSISFLVRSF